MSDHGVLRLPRRIRFAYGARSGLTDAVTSLGSRAFVVVDPFLASTDFFREAAAALSNAGIVTKIHTEVLPELPVESLEAAADVARGFAPDVIVGWGGGSALDASKLVALLVAHGGRLSDYYGENKVPSPVLPLVAVPTTAGTGSEATPVAVVSDGSRQLKVGISSPHLIPHEAIVDPELTLGAPASVTAASGIDALVHAVESYTAAELPVNPAVGEPVFTGRNALSDALSLEAVRLISTAIERAVHTPHDRDARASMARGSLLAGMAFGNTGTHLSHAIQYPVGAITHTAHGLGTGLLLPYVMQAIAPAVPDRLAAIGAALGVGSDPQAAIERVAEITEAIGIPKTLAELGVPRDELDQIADLTLASARLLAISPIPADRATIARIVTAAFTGDRGSLRT